MFALVYGFANAEMHSWSDPITIIVLIAAAALLRHLRGAQSRARHPLLRLRILRDQGAALFLSRSTSSAPGCSARLPSRLCSSRTPRLPPIQTRLAFLPLPTAIVATSMAVQNVLLKRLGPRPLMTLGLLLGAGAMVWLAHLTPNASYGAHVLPALLVLGVGMGATGAPAMFTATYKIPPADTGVASATVSTMQQVVGAVGASALSTIFASAVDSYLHTHTSGPRLIATAAVHGYTTAFGVTAAIFAAGAILTGTLMPSIQAPAATPQPTESRGSADASPEPSRA